MKMDNLRVDSLKIKKLSAISCDSFFILLCQTSRGQEKLESAHILHDTKCKVLFPCTAW